MIVFGICWAPFHVDRLMWSYMDEAWTVRHHQIFEYVHVVSGVLFYLSSAVNPVLYNLMSTRFREMFKEVMCHRTHHAPPRKYSLSVTRMTLRSTLSDALPTNGPAVVHEEVCGVYSHKEEETTFA